MINAKVTLDANNIIKNINSKKYMTTATIGWDNKLRSTSASASSRTTTIYGNARATLGKKSKTNNATVGYYLIKRGYKFYSLFFSKEFWKKINFGKLKNYYSANQQANTNRLANLGIEAMRRSITNYKGKANTYRTIKAKGSSKAVMDTHQFIKGVKNMKDKK